MQDPTEFRERFKAYKEGNKPYENGLPAYKNGTSNIIGLLDKDQLDTLHYIYDYYSNLGMGTLDIAGIAANMFKESSLRHNAKDSSGYHGYVLMSPDMQLAVKKAYGNLNPDTLLQFVYDQVTGNSKVKGYTNGTGYKYGQYKTGGDAAEAFRATFERNKAGRQQSRIDYGNQFYDYFTKRAIEKKIGKQPEPIVVKQDATTVRRAIPEQQTIHTYDNLEASPYVTGKPMIKLLPPIKYPDLYLMMEDDQWEPEFQLPKLKNGKLPRYGGGKINLLHNPTNATINDDGTFTDDYTKVFDDFYVTPSGVKTKYGSYTDKNWDRYKNYLNYLKYHDLSTGRIKGEPGLELTFPEFEIITGARSILNNFAPSNYTIKDFGYPQIPKQESAVFLKTPKNHKYIFNSSRNYGIRPKYSNPKENILSTLLQDEMLGEYIGRGAERLVFEDRRNPNRVIKIGGGINGDLLITNFDDLNRAIDYALEINKLPGVPPLSYEGFIEEHGKFIPWFSQQKVFPAKTIADPWHVFSKQLVLPNGKTASGKLSAIRSMDIGSMLKNLGYNPILGRPGFYTIDNYPYIVGDFGLKNVGFDALGNLKIFDPLIEL